MESARFTEVKTSAAGQAGAILQQADLFESANSPTFTGTSNPRHRRVIAELMRRNGIFREELDSIAGCSNGPELVAELRRRGLEIECMRIDGTDRDGRPSKPGWYYLTPIGRRQVREWLKANGA